jgi:tetratricopeptide (TPR) repeat protein
VSHWKRIRRQQIIREVEGYLELITVCADRWSLAVPARDRMAVRALDALDRLGPEWKRRSITLYLRGQALRCQEKYTEAILPLQQASELEPDHLETWLALGWCHKQCGRLDLAIQSLEEALAVDGNEAIIHYKLAGFWSLAGNAKLALGYLARAIDLDSKFRDLVANEPDFDPIRKHPEFRALTSVIV